MTEKKTLREWREELDLTVEEMARSMRVSERDLMKLEHSGQTYIGFDREWGMPISERYGFEKVFWYEPEKAVREWEEACDWLQAFAELADRVSENEPLIAALGDAMTRARQELKECQELRVNFERQEEQIDSETEPAK